MKWSTHIGWVCFTLIILPTIAGFSQSHKKVTHFEGTKTVNGVEVTVNCIGATDSLDYCDGDPAPYFIGYDGLTDQSGNGRVIFNFSEPVTDIVMSFAGTSDIDNHYEEVIVYINGNHYRLSPKNKVNGCGEELATVNEKGHLVGCRDCSVSGWSGTRIRGPIHSVMVIDTVIRGTPNGTVFSLLIGPPVSEQIKPVENTLTNYFQTMEEGSAGKELVIESEQLENTAITIKDANGKYITIHYQLIEPNKVVIDISDLTKGEYLLELKLNGKLESQRFLVE